jgi:large subunit ribosomal protein L21e
MPHPRYRGRTGRIAATRGKAYVVLVKDGRMEKELVIPPVHLRPAGKGS